ncbi:hypothetical protein [Demequina aurantiaca]|uniref:hypothetical protein n=1 Tax=Demequina aurantiaca TaxID=676200 RepID=UPI003D325CFD
MIVVAGLVVVAALGFAVVKIGGSVLADIDWEDGGGTGDVPYGDNTQVVGEDLGAGIYRSKEQVGVSQPGVVCEWSSFEIDGDDQRVVSGAASEGGFAMVLLEGGQGLTSSGCPEWVGTSPDDLTFDPDSAATTVTEGMWVVGKDVRPGTYRMVAPHGGVAEDPCYFSVSDTLSQTADRYLVNGRAEQGDVLTADAPLGLVFLNEGCGDWERIGD